MQILLDFLTRSLINSIYQNSRIKRKITAAKLGSKLKAKERKRSKKLNNDIPMKIHGVICDFPDVIGFRVLLHLIKTKKTAKDSSRTYFVLF